MQRNPIKKGLAVGIILLFIGTAIIPSSGQKIEKSSSRGNWLYVGGNGPGNYTTIQEAINDAFDGDTIFVFSGDYFNFPELNIEKSLILQGENPATTQLRMWIGVMKDNTVIKNFTEISYGDSSWGIGIRSNGNTIQNNIIISPTNGIQFMEGSSSSNNLIENNIFKNCSWNGVALWNGYNNTIKNNTFYNNYKGIEIYGSHDFILNNIMKDCGCGINLIGSQNTIDNNRLSNCDIVIFSKNNFVCHNKLDGSITLLGSSNTIEQNTMRSINLSNANHNTITQNNFVNNKRHAKFYSSTSNNWAQNYWGRPMNHPKIIRGSLLIKEYYLGYGRTWDLITPWINIDWHPAQKPYDILGMR